MRLAIIPARGGSKRIKNKNILDFFGKPLISYALDAAKKSKLFDKIHVSTDSKEIKDIVENLGYKVDFLRKSELADDFTGLFPVLKWVFNEYKKKGIVFEDVFCIMPCAPLLTSSDLKSAYKIFKNFNSKNPLLVASPYNVPIEWAFFRQEDSVLIPKDKKALLLRSQDIRPTFYESGPFNIFSAVHLNDDNFFNKYKYISYLINKSKAIDIDDLEDLELAKILYLGQKELNKKNFK